MKPTMVEAKNRIGYRWIEVDRYLYEVWQALCSYRHSEWRHEIREDGSIASIKKMSRG
jgi:hypothetical protein